VDIYIDGYIGKADFFSDGFSLKTLRETIGSSDEEINLHINSGGGDVTEGFAIYDYLMALPNKVNTIGEGIVGSIATVIFQAGRKGKRSIHANSEFFIHNPYWTPSGPEPMEAKDAQALAESLKKAEEKIVNFYVQNTAGKSKEQIKEKMNMQTSFDANEAIEWGFVDEVVGGEIKSKKQYAVMAFINNKPNQMSDFKTELERVESSILTKIAAFFKPAIKAGKLQSGEVTLFFEGDMATLGGDVFTDEAMTTPAPDGSYPTEGNTFVVEGGKIKEIVEPSADDVDALKAEIEALKTQIADKDSKLNAAKVEAENLNTKVAEATDVINAVKSDFDNFKAQYVTGGEAPKPEGQNFKGNEAEKTLVQKTLELRNNKNKN